MPLADPVIILEEATLSLCAAPFFRSLSIPLSLLTEPLERFPAGYGGTRPPAFSAQDCQKLRL